MPPKIHLPGLESRWLQNGCRLESRFDTVRKELLKKGSDMQETGGRRAGGERPGALLRLGSVLFCFAAVLAPCALATTKQADLILTGGKVLVMDKDFSIESTVVVKDGKIVAVGHSELARQYQAPRNLDLKGRVLLPGFTDTHVHIIPQSRRDIDLSDISSIAALQEAVRAKARELGPGRWVTGYGWDEAKFAEKRNPVRADLDAAAPDNPVVLIRAGQHSAVGNSAALKIAGITRDTPQPERGVIEHNAAGEPNGIIRERWDLYGNHFPPISWEEIRSSYIDKLKGLLALGITSLMEATGSIDDEPVGKGGVASPSGRATFHRLQAVYAEQGADLPRMAMYISYPGEERLKAFPHRTGYGDEHLRIGPIGESAVDGGFTGPTAWTLVDYKGMPGFRGKGFYTDAQLQALTDTCARLGWQVGLHAIGDAAIVQAVNAYSKSLNTIVGVNKDHRWFLDHFTIMPPEATMNTMAHDHILIAQQPNFTYTLEGRYLATLDDWRVQHTNSVATPWKHHGLFVAFGSDNLPIGPMVGLYTAVTRKGQSGRVYGAEEAIGIRDALRMYTANGPYLTWEEKVKGTLEPGKLADMIVLDSDPLTSDPQKLLTTKVDLTILGGKVVYDRSQHMAMAVIQ
jgi:predicted amidohydrolase YtcJ